MTSFGALQLACFCCAHAWLVLDKRLVNVLTGLSSVRIESNAFSAGVHCKAGQCGRTLENRVRVRVVLLKRVACNQNLAVNRAVLKHCFGRTFWGAEKFQRPHAALGAGVPGQRSGASNSKRLKWIAVAGFGRKVFNTMLFFEVWAFQEALGHRRSSMTVIFKFQDLSACTGRRSRGRQC